MIIKIMAIGTPAITLFAWYANIKIKASKMIFKNGKMYIVFVYCYMLC